MRSVLLSVCVCLAALACCVEANANTGQIISYSGNTMNTNPGSSVPMNVVLTQCTTAIPTTATAGIAAAYSNCGSAPYGPETYYVGNACNPSSPLLLLSDAPTGPGCATGHYFLGSTICIPVSQIACNLPTSAGASGLSTTSQFNYHNCFSNIPGSCPTHPLGPAAALAQDPNNGWAVPRVNEGQSVLGTTAYPVIATGSFPTFPLGADGTFIFPTAVQALHAYSTQSTSFGTAQFDGICRGAGPANSRAIICADGTNQNYFSAPLTYGFSPASRSAFTFMTYGQGNTIGLVGETGNLINGEMNNYNPSLYAQYVLSLAAGSPYLTPEMVLQNKAKQQAVFSFDPLASPSPTFVQIADSVSDFINQGINRGHIVAQYTAALSGQSASTIAQAQVNAFQAFYRGEEIGCSSGCLSSTPTYFAGVVGAPNGGASQTQIYAGYVTEPAWTGCFGPGTYAGLVNGVPQFNQFPAYAGSAAYPNGFIDPRFSSQTNNANVLPPDQLPSAPGYSMPTTFTCSDWTSQINSVGSQNPVVGAVGDPGLVYYSQGNPANVGQYVNGATPNPNNPYVTDWLNDDSTAQPCSTTSQNVYCSWFPTNTDGVMNGDETGIDCGGTTLGPDNEGLPTQSCGCTAGYFYDYYNALCIPCMQDTYCNLAGGCVNDCFPCFTAPTSGPAVTGLFGGTSDNTQALYPYEMAQPNAGNENSVDTTPAFGGVTPQAANPASQPLGAQFNTNSDDVVLVGTTFNQLTQQYDFAATRCYCNYGFVTSTTGTATSDEATGTVSGTVGTHGASNNVNNALYVNATGYGPSANYGAGFANTVANHPLDGSNCVPVVRGDPQITGLQGQDFQVHGIPDEVFNMVSHPELQVNAHFVYLEEAKCDNYTVCFSHAGTYIDQIGMNIAGQHVKVLAGTIEEGLRVFVQGEEITVGTKKQLNQARVFFSAQRKVHIRTPLFSFAFVGTDKFMNQEIALLDAKLAKLGSPLVTLKVGQARPHSEVPLHGIVGQTWQNLHYPDGMMIEGAVADYRIEESDLFGNTFAFNKFVEQ